MLHAERSNMGIVDQIARRPRIAESFQKDSEVRRAVSNHHQRWRFPKPFQALDRFFLIAGRIEDSGMGNDPEKLVCARPRYCPWVGLLR